MIKLMAAIRRRPGMTQQEYFPYIREVHGGLSKAHPLTVRRYVQNHAWMAHLAVQRMLAIKLCSTGIR
jgi:hypothetical protein